MFRYSTPSRVDQIWDEQKKKLQHQFTNLTDEDLFFETGKKYDMIEKVGIKLGKSDTEINKIFQAL
jgi:hypothetical protein